jgi:hypothetical protein
LFSLSSLSLTTEWEARMDGSCGILCRASATSLWPLGKHHVAT